MRQLNFSLNFITTVTTRPRRTGEGDKDYHFVSEAKFREMIERRELLEYASVYGNWYGVPRQPVQQALDREQDTVVKVDIQGAAAIKKILPQAVLIFLMPPSMEELMLRLKQRRTESSFDLALRSKIAAEEIKQLSLFDYVVVSQRDEIDRVVANIGAIITAEKCRVAPGQVSL
jgi:guanylate kinase